MKKILTVLSFALISSNALAENYDERRYPADNDVGSVTTEASSPETSNDYSNAQYASAPTNDRSGRLYVGLTGTYSLKQDSDYEFVRLGASGKTDYEFSDSFGVGASLGYNINNNIRTEVEFMYRNHESEAKKIGAVTFTSREFDSYTTMLNGYYDFVNSSAFTPYVGAGAGATYHEDSGEGHFAYQLMSGVSYDVGSSDRVSVGYRYFNASEVSLTGRDKAGNPASDKYSDLIDHSVEVGYKHSF